MWYDRLEMTRRELIGWYVLYGSVIAGTGAVFWWLLAQNRIMDGIGVSLMAVGALWVSITNHHDPDPPPNVNGSLNSYDPW